MLRCLCFGGTYNEHGPTNHNLCSAFRTCKKKHPAYGEFERKCSCRKHFRWTQSGKQYRRKANTRAWAEAEKAKRELEDHLAGRAPHAESENSARDLGACVSVFLQDKQVQGIAPNTLREVHPRASPPPGVLRAARRLYGARDYPRIAHGPLCYVAEGIPDAHIPEHKPVSVFAASCVTAMRLNGSSASRHSPRLRLTKRPRCLYRRKSSSACLPLSRMLARTLQSALTISHALWRAALPVCVRSYASCGIVAWLSGMPWGCPVAASSAITQKGYTALSHPVRRPGRTCLSPSRMMSLQRS